MAAISFSYDAFLHGSSMVLELAPGLVASYGLMKIECSQETVVDPLCLVVEEIFFTFEYGFRICPSPLLP